MIQTDDKALIARIAAGDEAAFAELYRAYEKRIYWFINKKLNDPFEAADILHIVFMDVWQKAEQFEGRSKVSTWLFGIAFNKTVDRMRRKIPTPMDEQDSGAHEIADEAPPATELIQASEENEHLRHCLDRLNDEQRAVIDLAFFEDMAYGEISEVVGIPEGTVKTRAFHARKALKSCLNRRLGAVS